MIEMKLTAVGLVTDGVNGPIGRGTNQRHRTVTDSTFGTMLDHPVGHAKCCTE